MVQDGKFRLLVLLCAHTYITAANVNHESVVNLSCMLPICWICKTSCRRISLFSEFGTTFVCKNHKH